MLLFKGINLSGLESGTNILGKNGTDYRKPQSYHYDYWFGNQIELDIKLGNALSVSLDLSLGSNLSANKNNDEAGMNIVRLPFKWERIQTELYGSLNQDYLALLKEQVSYATSKNASIILDLHNSGQYSVADKNGQVSTNFVGSPKVPTSALQNLWKQLANEFKDNKNVIFEIMNEPTKDISAAAWKDISQKTLLTIRDTGATNQVMLSGNYWSTASLWVTAGNAAAFKDFYDPLNNYSFDIHQYFNQNGSGNGADFIDDPVSRLQEVTEWARETNNKLFLGETAVSLKNSLTSSENADKMQEVVNFLDRNSDVWLGYSMWGGGEFWSDDYIFKLTPLLNGLGNLIFEQSEALWLKNLKSTLNASDNIWDETSVKQTKFEKVFEAEDLKFTGGYKKEINNEASGKALLVVGSGTGTINLNMTEPTGKYNINIKYFDESDGQSTYTFRVNGKTISEFTATENTKNVLRTKSNSRYFQISNVTLKKGDVLSFISNLHKGELGSIDSIMLSSTDSAVTNTLDEAVISTSLANVNKIDFKAYVASQNDGNLKLTVQDGSSFTMKGNGWQSLDVDYKITKNTIVSVDFKTLKKAEIQGIGFADSSELKVSNDKKFFQFAGSQKYGTNLSYSGYKENKDYNFTVNVGRYFTGDNKKIVFMNDDDAHAGGTGQFSDLKFYEITNTIYGSSKDTNFISTQASERMIAGTGKDRFILREYNLDKADSIQNFNAFGGDKLVVSSLAKDLGRTVDNIVASMSLQAYADGSGALLLNYENSTHTLALFENNMLGVSLKNIIGS